MTLSECNSGARDVSFRRILFVELLGGIGDVVIALSAMQTLGRSHSSAQLTVLTFAPGGELLQSDPLIHRVVCVSAGNARQAVEELLDERSFDLIVSDTNYDSIAELIQTSGARVVTNLWRSPPADQRVSDRFLQILLAEGLVSLEAIAPPQLHLTPAELGGAQQALRAAYRPLVFLYPDAGMPVKRWGSENFISLGRALQQRYGATVIVPVGADPAAAGQIATAIGGTAQIWQRGSLRELAAGIAHADLVVAADTGLAHIAVALSIPTVTLFGPSWYGRYGQSPPHINLQGYPDCPERVPQNFTEQRCWDGECPFDQWQTCLEAIAPTDVLVAAAPLLEARDWGLGAREDTFHSKPQNYSCGVATRTKLNSSWANVRNILVMRLDNIGDVIMTSPALRAIKKNLPQARLTLMASSGGALTAPLLPWVDEVLPCQVLWQDLGRLSFEPEREWKLVDMLRSRQFDAAIIFTSFSQSPHPAGFICYLAGIPLRLGESKELGAGVLTTEVPAAPDEMHQVERNLRLIEAVGFQVSDLQSDPGGNRSLALQIPSAAREKAERIKAKGRYILLNPWTSCQSRNYDQQRFAIAARQLAETTGYSIVVTGVEKDRDRSDKLLDTLGACAIDLIGKTSLPELAALIADAQLVLTNNTSTMHIADATRTPTVVMFAGTELECQWQPRHTPVKLLRRPTVCSPCYAFTCPYQLECLDIPPEQVVAAGLELMSISP